MFTSGDFLLDGKYTLHLARNSGFIIVSDLENLSEIWIECRVVVNSRTIRHHEVKVVSGDPTPDHMAAARCFVDSLIDNLQDKKHQHALDQVGATLNFMLNLSLNQDILKKPAYIRCIARTLGSLVQEREQEQASV